MLYPLYIVDKDQPECYSGIDPGEQEQNRINLQAPVEQRVLGFSVPV